MHCLTVFLALVLLSTSAVAEDRLDVGRFSQQTVEGWQLKSFAGESRYSLQQLEGRSVLFAESEGSAAAFYKKIKIDLTKTPVLNWSWRKHRSINPGNETDKAGDDYVARLYVIKDGGLFFWKTRVLNYVWSYQHSRDDVWNNPFAGNNARMIAQRDASSPDGEWRQEQRNVVEDFAELYGIKIESIDGIALMTDSDNSGLTASAYYGDIYFTPR